MSNRWYSVVVDCRNPREQAQFWSAGRLLDLLCCSMRLLVLGGTAWLGRAVAGDAIARGHTVTCLARGQAGHGAAGTQLLRADRDRSDAYDEIRGNHWDAVVDVARQPGHVRRAVTTLAPSAERYLFVSSANVYASQRDLGADEDAPLLSPLASDVMESMETYGQAKVACEQAVLDGFGVDRALIARVGLIGGGRRLVQPIELLALALRSPVEYRSHGPGTG